MKSIPVDKIEPGDHLIINNQEMVLRYAEKDSGCYNLYLDGSGTQKVAYVMDGEKVIVSV